MDHTRKVEMEEGRSGVGNTQLTFRHFFPLRALVRSALVSRSRFGFR